MAESASVEETLHSPLPGGFLSPGSGFGTSTFFYPFFLTLSVRGDAD